MLVGRGFDNPRERFAQPRVGIHINAPIVCGGRLATELTRNDRKQRTSHDAFGTTNIFHNLVVCWRRRRVRVLGFSHRQRYQHSCCESRQGSSG